MKELLSVLWDNKDVAVSFISGGALLWLWQALSGYFYVNLSVQLEPRRTPATTPGSHDLVVLVKLKKGKRATLALDEIVVWLFSGSQELKRMSLLAEKPICDIKSEVIQRRLNITPGEETHFAFHHTVPENCTCLIVARVMRRSVLGKQWRRAVWLASEISPPYLKDATKSMPNPALNADAGHAPRAG